MDKPNIGVAAGLAWRPRKHGWAAVWLCRQDIARKGFKPSTHQIGIYTEQPTDGEITEIVEACERLQDEMYAFGEAAPKVFGGTIRELVNLYQTDKDSRYHAMRYRGRQVVDRMLARIVAKHGACKLADLGARDFKAWYEGFRWPDGKDGRELVSTAYLMITIVRMVFKYGVVYEVDAKTGGHCIRLKVILKNMAFEQAKGRTEVLSLRQCEDIIAAANAEGAHSIALVQALQRNLGIRQKDALGEWVPLTEPGVSAVIHRGRKWISGITWEEISSDFILTHKMSKSRMGKVIEFDLKLYPMVMAELLRIPEAERDGPLVKRDGMGRPWAQNTFGRNWRRIATACGVPANVLNMDSRAGTITEIIAATGGNMEAARKQAGHSDASTTRRYSRDQLQSNSDTAVIVADFRAKNTA